MTDDVEVELLDDAPATRTVELRPRRRWRELALVVAAIAAVVGVGLIGDRDTADEAEAAPTTTSSARRPDRPTTTRRPATSVTRPRTTTSTTEVQGIRYTDGSGPVLPELPMTLGALNAVGEVLMTDLATGARCWVRPASGDPSDAWMAWSSPVVAGGLLVQTNDGTHVVARDCTILDLAIDFHSGYPVTGTADRLWMGSGDGSHLTEHALPSGEKTGRVYDVPRNMAVTTVAAGADLVVGVNGSMTLVDPSTDVRRDLGPGTPLATHGSLVAFSECPELRCRVGLLDLITGERRVIEDIQATSWEPSQFSADGRFLLVAVPSSRSDQSAIALIDVAAATAEVFDEGLARPTLSPDGRWLLGQVGGKIVAYDLRVRAPRVDLLADIMSVQGFALL